MAHGSFEAMQLEGETERIARRNPALVDQVASQQKVPPYLDRTGLTKLETGGLFDGNTLQGRCRRMESETRSTTWIWL